jgi:hypothetical protein
MKISAAALPGRRCRGGAQALGSAAGASPQPRQAAAGGEAWVRQGRDSREDPLSGKQQARNGPAQTRVAHSPLPAGQPDGNPYDIDGPPEGRSSV